MEKETKGSEKMDELQFLKSINTLISKRIYTLESNSDESKRIKKLYFELYKQKGKEVAGREVKVPWSAKEGKLFKDDIYTFGPKVLENLIYIFFSDKDYSVASFTRYKNKAGYGYGVFHGMIGKLQMSNVKIEKPCQFCGKIGGHEYDCKIMVEKREKKQKEVEEINKFREENPDVKIFQNFLKIKGA